MKEYACKARENYSLVCLNEKESLKNRQLWLHKLFYRV